MVRRLVLSAVMAALAALLLLIAGLCWIWATEEGGRWLFSHLGQWSGGRVAVARIEGRLMDRLSLQDLSVRLEKVHIHLERLSLDWKPVGMLQGRLRIGELSLEQVQLVLQAFGDPASGSSFLSAIRWPEKGFLPPWLDVRVDRFAADDIRLRTPAAREIGFGEVQGRLAIHGGRLDLEEFVFHRNPGRYAARVSIDAGVRTADVQLRLDLDHPAGPFDSLGAAVEVGEGVDGEPAGTISFHGSFEGSDRLRAKSPLRLAGNRLVLEGIELWQPHRKGVFRGTGGLQLAPELLMELQLQVQGLDLEKETGLACGIDGEITARGLPNQFNGRVKAACKGQGWQDIGASGPFEGTLQGMEFPALDLRLLNGRAGGRLGLLWRDGFELQGEFKASRLDTAQLRPDLKGVLNGELRGSLRVARKHPFEADISCRLTESILQNRALHGRLDGRIRGRDLELSHLELQGAGFDLRARGRLSERIRFETVVDRLGLLDSRFSGSVQGQGWVRFEQGNWSAETRLQGQSLELAGYALGQLDLDSRAESLKGPFALEARVKDLRHGKRRFTQGSVQVDGIADDHRGKLDLVWQGGEAQGSFRGGWLAGKGWQGTLESLAARDQGLGFWQLQNTADLHLGDRSLWLTEFGISGPDNARIQGALGLQWLRGLAGDARLDWEDVNLGLLQPWVGRGRLGGKSTGKIDLRIPGEDSLLFDGEMRARGSWEEDGLRLGFEGARAELKGSEQGWDGSLVLEVAGGGQVRAVAHSAEPARPAMPADLDLRAALQGLNLKTLEKKLPPGLDVQGSLSAEAAGQLRGTGDLALKGRAEAAHGRLFWRGRDGETGVDLEKVVLGWDWSGQSFRGSLDLDLSGEGRAAGDFSLPLPAVLPARFDGEGALLGKLDGSLKEKGLLSAIFPSLVDETRGEMDLALQLGGTWEHPSVSGTFELGEAGGYLPALGVTLGDVEARASLQGDRVVIESFHASAGPGRIRGAGIIQMNGKRLDQYKFHLQGKDFQILRIPEIELLVDPDLEVVGNGQKVQIRGKVHVPEMLLSKAKKQDFVTESPDVVLLGRKASAPTMPTLGLDLETRLTLGDRVMVNVEGLDAKLGGELELYGTDWRQINGRGRFEVREGHYSTYGVKLKITRGYLLFSGGPVDRPTLDVLAVRSIGKVLAGVQVAGTPRKPEIKLYSEPSMPDTDILSYVVLGRPMGAESPGQADVLMKAAGFLLNKGDSAVLQDRIKRFVGLDVIEVETSGDTVGGSMVTLGKYLTPNLYVSFGRSIFADTSAAQLRYTLGKHWEVESKLGEQSGADLYYKIEFQ